MIAVWKPAWVRAAVVAGLLVPTTAAAYEFPQIERGVKPERAFQIGDVDHVRLFNGGLLLTIPIGQTYVANEGTGLSMQLALTYNSQIWDYVTADAPPQHPEPTVVQAWPVRGANAGLGWRLSLGEYWDDSGSPSEPGRCADCYVGPDGARQQFLVGTTVGHTTDSTYVRLRKNPREIDMPNGEIHRFDSEGRLVEKRDRLGNSITVSYGPSSWTIIDGHRTHTVNLVSSPYYGQAVGSVELAGFGGTTATYSFSYTSRRVPRSCVDDDPNTSEDIMLPLLTSVTLPDNSKYEMPESSYHLDSSSIPCYQDSTPALEGLLKKLDLPTGGSVEWLYRAYNFPVPIEGDNGEEPLWLRKTTGVSSRTLRDVGGAALGTWSYRQSLPGGQQAVESITKVTTPAGDRTDHYFRVGQNVDAVYGLPFSPVESAPGHPNRFRSTKVYDCQPGGTGCTLLRTTYLDYEIDSQGGFFERNPRVRASYTRYHDDGDRHTYVERSDWDGVGHYRQEVRGGDLVGAQSRTIFTNYVLQGAPSTSEPWILTRFHDRTVTEGARSTRSDYCFDGATGYLEAVRTRKLQGSVGVDDVIVQYVDGNDDGNPDETHWFGGDTAAAPTPGNLCNLSADPSTAAYRMEHTYSHGVRSFSRYVRPNGTPMPFASLDLTIDQSTGLVAASRDVSGLGTSYEYDRRGRPAWVKPSQNGWTQYVFTKASATSGPRLGVIRRDNGSKSAPVLAHDAFDYDGLGRLIDQERLMPNGVWTHRTTEYHPAGWVERRSVWASGNSGTSAADTVYSNHDPFGRPGRVQAPDGTAITYDYVGDRVTRQNVTIGGVSSQTRLRYDSFGRLSSVAEPSDPTPGASPDDKYTHTGYTYDEGNRLIQVFTNPGPNRTTQTRTFEYDRRGFLVSESHPELGSTVFYSDYDALGNAGRIQRGGWDLAYAYDAGARLNEIRERGTSRVWKSWSWASGNTQGWSKGKVASATRHNRVFVPGSATEFDAWVEETYTYGGRQGRISNVHTVVGVGNPDDNTRPTYDYSLAYDALGNVTSRSYPECTNLYCVNVSQPRTVTQTFSNGYLTAIPGYASSITYHPNSLHATVAHANGVTSVQEGDLAGMTRPRRLRTSGASRDFDTGQYAYDGAGNITGMGTHQFAYDTVSRLVSADVEVPGSPCEDELVLQSGTEFGTASHQSCGTIQAGPDYTVAATGDLTLTAGHRVALVDGFSVAAGGRLTAGTDPSLDPGGQPDDATQSYAFDPYGNLRSVTTDEDGQSPVTRTFETNESTNRLNGASYDTAGNVTAYGSWRYRWDPFGMLWQARPGNGGGNGFTFVYGPGDERLWTIDWTRGTSASNWLETWTLRDVDGTPLRQFQLDGGNTPTGNWTLHRDYVRRGGSLLAAHTPEGLRHFHLDHLGTPRIVTDASGKTVSEHFYYPFGEEASDPSENAEVMKFTGHERDDLDGGGSTFDLDYMHARYCSPHTGRFLSVDPLERYESSEAPQVWNRYAYVVGNPLRYVDPTGEAMMGTLTPTADKGWTECDGIIGCALHWVNKALDSDPMGVTSLANPISVVTSAPKALTLLRGVRGARGSRLDQVTRAALTTGSRQANAAGKIISFVTSEDRIFYRVFSGENSVGSFLTAARPRGRAFAIEALDLPPGNSAEFVQEVLVPAGTRLQRSRVRPGAFGGSGGAEQFELLEFIPIKNFGPGMPLR